MIMLGDIALDGGDQFVHAGKAAAANAIAAKVAKEPLDHVEPGGAGGRKVHVKTRMTLEPTDHGRMLARPVIIGPRAALPERLNPPRLYQETVTWCDVVYARSSPLLWCMPDGCDTIRPGSNAVVVETVAAKLTLCSAAPVTLR